MSELSKVCGSDTMERIITVFGGMELKIPSHEDMAKMERDLDIYNSLVDHAPTSSDGFKIVRRTIQAKYGMKKTKVLDIYKTLDKLHKRGQEIKATDEALKGSKKFKKKVKR